MKTVFAHFNSIKVQLEPEILEKNGWKDEFQFHKGTIRTQSSHGACKIHFSFQFHKGTIRTADKKGPNRF